MNWQNSNNMIVQAVGQRGYLDKPAGEILALQVPKMVEETYELACTFATDMPGYWYYALRDCAARARELFATGKAGTADDALIRELRSELADITVVVHVMWAALEELAGERYDADQEAYRKARGDVGRGVR